MSGNYTINAPDRALENAGKQLAKGAVSYLATLFFFFLLLLAPISWVVDKIVPRDSTDSATERSGMRPHTDYGTGCQYLETSAGSITPRMGADGKQICR